MCAVLAASSSGRLVRKEIQALAEILEARADAATRTTAPDNDSDLDEAPHESSASSLIENGSSAIGQAKRSVA